MKNKPFVKNPEKTTESKSKASENPPKLEAIIEPPAGVTKAAAVKKLKKQRGKK